MKKNLPRNAAGKTFGEHLCDKLGYDIVLPARLRATAGRQGLTPSTLAAPLFGAASRGDPDV